MDLAERLTTTRHGLFSRTVTESAALGDRETVTRWIRELHRRRDQVVIIHRPWGSVCVVADGRPLTDVFMTDGETTWYAAAPGATRDQKLTPGRVEYLMLDALASAGPPEWPEWRDL